MRLSDLHAYFKTTVPFADGIFDMLVYGCPNDPRRKRMHAVHFWPPINPHGPEALRNIEAALNTNEGWRQSPKWTRVSGETVDTLTLTPSLARACCHFTITNGITTP